MKIHEILQLLEEWAPLQYAEDFDNTGLLTGDANVELTGVLIAHDTLEKTVEEAIAEGCNLIVSFHPIIFSGLKRLTGQDYVQRTVIKALQNGISIYAMHTALDNRLYGISGKMAEVLGLQDVKVLIPQSQVIKKLNVYVPVEHADQVRQALFDAGAGEIGNYAQCSFNVEGTGTYLPGEGAQPAIGEVGKWQREPEVCITVYFERHLERKVLNAMWQVHPYEEVAYEVISLNNEHAGVGLGVYGHLPGEFSLDDFLKKIKSVFHTENIRYSDYRGESIRKVALLGGSGAFAIDAARRVKADALVTSDLKYHDFFKGGNDLLLADIGHYESERYTKNLIYDYLTKKMINIAAPEKGLKIILSKVDTNPIKNYH